jgi:hypothetical protein
VRWLGGVGGWRAGDESSGLEGVVCWIIEQHGVGVGGGGAGRFGNNRGCHTQLAALYVYACDFSPRAVELVKAHPEYVASGEGGRGG